jgi:integrase
MLTDTKIAAIKPPATGQEEHPDHKVTGLRLRVGAGGSKTWIVRRRIKAKVLNRKLGTYPSMKLSAARISAEKLIAALERDGSTEAIDRTMGDLASVWIDRVAKVKNRGWKLQERMLALHVLPHWRDRKLSDIERAEVRELIRGIEGEVLPNRVLATIRTAFRWALSEDWIAVSPVEGIKKPKEERPRDRVLDMTEIAKVWHSAALGGYPFGHFVQLLILTAQRRTEVAGMQWADVDMEAATWTLRAEDTKANRATLVPFSPQAMAILKALPKMGPFALTTDGETHLQDYAKGKARLDQFIAAAGEPLAPWTLHDLRRSAATNMVRLGITETTVGRILNHAAQGVTARVYALHSYAPEKRHALDTWGAEVDRTVHGDNGGNVVQLRV